MGSGDNEPANDFIFIHGNQNANHHLGANFFIHMGIMSEVKRIVIVSDRMQH
jgi:hypothetical protein